MNSDETMKSHDEWWKVMESDESDDKGESIEQCSKPLLVDD